MTVANPVNAPVRHADRFYIGGEWVKPSSDAAIDVVDSVTEELFVRVAEAKDADMERAIAAARQAFDDGPWPQLTHAQRAEFLRAIADGVRSRSQDLAQIWPRQSGILHSIAESAMEGVASTYEHYADLATTYQFEERVAPAQGGFGLLVREPVGVVGAIIPWNGPLPLITSKVAPALLAGCTVIIKVSPEAPGEAYVFAEIVESIGLPPGVINVLTADREVSELLVRDPRVDKIAFTGSTAAGRRIASLLGERIGRYTLELGGKSAAVVLDDIDLATAAATIAAQECFITGQVCSSLTRIVVSRHRHDEIVEALVDAFSKVRVGDPFDADVQMGPLATLLQRDRVEGFIGKGVEEGATLAYGGGRPNVENSSTIAQNEIFGPVLTVIAAKDEDDAIRIANDTIYGLNASVFTNDSDRARDVARRLRSGTVGHNCDGSNFDISFGGFKQSGIGREGGREGLKPYLETKLMVLKDPPAGYPD
jgi:acyl-CoA reductase-like NAD-dependent aldehyde dehydrogenase